MMKGRVVLRKKNVLDLQILHEVDELLGNKVSFQLVSSVHADPGTVVFILYHFVEKTLIL